MQQRPLSRALILSRQPSADVDEPSARYVRRGKGVRISGHGVVGCVEALRHIQDAEAVRARRKLALEPPWADECAAREARGE